MRSNLEGPDNAFGSESVAEGIDVRVMGPGDVPAVIAMDAREVGHPREAYLQEKVAACIEAPGINISLIAESDGIPVGFLIGQIFYGEFGIASPRAVLDTIGVHPDFRQMRVGRALVEQFRRNLAVLRVEAIDTLVEWRRHDLMAFFDALGFRPSRDVDLIWDLDRHAFSAMDSDAVVRRATPSDLPSILAIDKEEMPGARSMYFDAKLKAQQARPDGNVFLVAEAEGRVAGFAVGMLYHGEFGIDTTRGVIDSLGVAAAARHQGVGAAILKALYDHARAAGVHEIETLVRWNRWNLIQFFEYVGFRPSTRINLEWRFA